MKVNKILKKLNNSCSNEPLEDDDKEIGYFRELNRGKSFDFSEWKPLTKYTNDVFKQDFVSYENVLLVCKETHISENPPVLEYDSDGNPIGVLSKEWYWAFSASALITGLKIKVDDDLSVESTNPVQNKVITDAFSNINTNFTSELNKKVDKEIGKQLSEENFTSELKEKLEGLNNYDDSKIIASVTDVHETLSNKQDVISDLDVIREGALKGATALQGVPNNYITRQQLENELSTKVDKVYGKGLSVEDFTTTLKHKLESLENYNDTSLKNDVETLQKRLNTLVNNNASDAIDSFNEIVKFLEGVSKSEDLDGIIYNIEQQISDKQNILVSSKNIKTVNGKSLLGEGDLYIQTDIPIDDELSFTSNNPVKNSVITNKITNFGSRINELEIAVDEILNPTINPTFINPNASISLVGYNSLMEIGSEGPTVSNFKTSYNAGSININGVKQNDRGGSHNVTESFIFINSDPTNKELPKTILLGNTTFKYRAYYKEGPQPKDNKGNDYGSPLAEGYVDSAVLTINGTWPWYASTSTATSENPVIKQSLVTWASTMKTGNFTLRPSGSLPQVFKLPKQIKSLQMKNAVGQMETVGLTDYTETTEIITLNGNTQTYYVYTYNGSTRGEVTLNATF